jgi:E3 ubiquitin-protein ligase UBR2
VGFFRWVFVGGFFIANPAQVCPPPSLPPLTANYSGLERLLSAPLLLYLLDLVLARADNLKSRCFSEDQVHKVLYLVGIGLLEEERRTKSEAGGETRRRPPPTFSRLAREAGILASLERLVGSHRIESHRELLAWVLRKMRQNLGIQEGGGGATTSEEEVGASAFGDGPAEEDSGAKARKMAAAAARRAKIMQQMAAQQKTFMTENIKLFEETPSGLRGADPKASICDWGLEEGEGGGAAASVQVCLGPNRSAAGPVDSSYTCILCQEDEELDTDSRTLVMASFIQKSTVLSRVPRGQAAPLAAAPLGSGEFPFLAADLRSAPHTSSCGHVMHATCWQKYFDDVSETERRRYRLALWLFSYLPFS